MEAKLKHLEFIENTISRMAGNSFLLKGWAVTLVGALLALSFKELNWRYITVSLVVLFFFWLLDGYYLTQEGLFIKLYNHARQVSGTATDFSMDTTPFRKKMHWFGCIFSKTLVLFYGGLLAVHLLVLYIII